MGIHRLDRREHVLEGHALYRRLVAARKDAGQGPRRAEVLLRDRGQQLRQVRHRPGQAHRPLQQRRQDHGRRRADAARRGGCISSPAGPAWPGPTTSSARETTTPKRRSSARASSSSSCRGRTRCSSWRRRPAKACATSASCGSATRRSAACGSRRCARAWPARSAMSCTARSSTRRRSSSALMEHGRDYGIRRLGGRTKMVNHVEACFPTPSVDYVPALFGDAEREFTAAYFSANAQANYRNTDGSYRILRHRRALSHAGRARLEEERQVRP